MPMTIWFRPNRTHSTAMNTAVSTPPRIPPRKPSQSGVGLEGDEEAHIGAHQHHALDADIEHTGLFGHLLAQSGQQKMGMAATMAPV